MEYQRSLNQTKLRSEIQARNTFFETNHSLGDNLLSHNPNSDNFLNKLEFLDNPGFFIHNCKLTLIREEPVAKNN
jgi:hypothetical protein